jgi:hypothetical protein
MRSLLLNTHSINSDMLGTMLLTNQSRGTDGLGAVGLDGFTRCPTHEEGEASLPSKPGI